METMILISEFKDMSTPRRGKQVQQKMEHEMETQGPFEVLYKDMQALLQQ